MIKERAETEKFTLEITLKTKDSEAEIAYKQSIKSITCLVAGGISSGELFPFFMKELTEVGKNMLFAIQTEQALEGE